MTTFVQNRLISRLGLQVLEAEDSFRLGLSAGLMATHDELSKLLAQKVINLFWRPPVDVRVPSKVDSVKRPFLTDYRGDYEDVIGYKVKILNNLDTSIEAYVHTPVSYDMAFTMGTTVNASDFHARNACQRILRIGPGEEKTYTFNFGKKTKPVLSNKAMHNPLYDGGEAFYPLMLCPTIWFCSLVLLGTGTSDDGTQLGLDVLVASLSCEIRYFTQEKMGGPKLSPFKGDTLVNHPFCFQLRSLRSFVRHAVIADNGLGVVLATRIGQYTHFADKVGVRLGPLSFGYCCAAINAVTHEGVRQITYALPYDQNSEQFLPEGTIFRWAMHPISDYHNQQIGPTCLNDTWKVVREDGFLCSIAWDNEADGPKKFGVRTGTKYRTLDQHRLLPVQVLVTGGLDLGYDLITGTATSIVRVVGGSAMGTRITEDLVKHQHNALNNPRGDMDLAGLPPPVLRGTRLDAIKAKRP